MMNYKNVVDAIRKITQEDGLGMSAIEELPFLHLEFQNDEMLGDENLKSN